MRRSQHPLPRHAYKSSSRRLRKRGLGRDEALRILADHRAEIESRGVETLALFGSVARDEARLGSDVDVLVEFARPTGLFELTALQEYLQSVLDRPVHLTTPDGLKRQIRAAVLEESVPVG